MTPFGEAGVVAMANHSKLASLFTRLTDTSLRALRRRKTGVPSQVAAQIELLESRQMLTPVLISLEMSALQYEQSPAPITGPARAVTAVSSAIDVTDGTAVNLTSATIQITGNYRINEDVLLFSNTATITGTWDASTGKLTLTGTDTLANYTAALRSVGYTNVAKAASSQLRTLTFQATNENLEQSSTVARDIAVTPVNLAASLTGIESSVLNYLQHSIPPGWAYNNITPISSTITIAPGLDPTSTTITTARIRFSSGLYNAAEDRLVFNNTGTITGSFNSTTGILTLSGTDTLANYQAALRSVSYTNLAINPTAGDRDVIFQVTDSNGNSNSLDRLIFVTPVDAPPVLTGLETTALVYIDHPVSTTPPTVNANVNVTNSITVNDSDTPNIVSATISISGNYANGQDLLTVVPTATIQVTWDASTGTLTLFGQDTLAAYTAVLRSVTYTNTSLNPSTATRTISFNVSDQFGYTSSNVSRNVQFVHNNVAPALANLEPPTLNYLARGTPVNVTSTLQVVDSDSPNLRSVSIKISNNYIAGEDQLSFTPVNNVNSHIGGAWDSTSGTLTLFGVGTLADYQLALRSVTYTNLAPTPTPVIRTLTFTPADELGQCGDSVSRDIVIVAINTPPILRTIESTPLAYIDHTVGGGFPVVQGTPVANITTVSSTISIDDPTSTYLQAATVKITGNYVAGEDRLTFTNTSTISGLWDASTGTLSLMGVDSIANYTAALRSVGYTNLAYDNGRLLDQSMRTVTYQVKDDSNLVSLTASRDIQIIHNNNPPTVVNPDSTILSYTEQTPAVAITPGLTLTDTDNTTLSQAIITLSSDTPDSTSGDALTFSANPATMGNITGVYNSGVLTLTSSGSTATLAQWQAALRSVSYSNSADYSNSSLRRVSIQVTDANGLNSPTPATRSIAIVPLNDPPQLTGIESTNGVWTEDIASVVTQSYPQFLITSSLTVSDPDSTTLSGATIQITTGYQSNQDLLAYFGSLSITSHWNSTTGTLTLTGAASLADYTFALQSVGYINTSATPSILQRTVSFTVTDNEGAASNVATRNVSITPVDNPPTITGIESTPLSYAEDAVNYVTANITQSIQLNDVDSNMLQQATISFSGYQIAEDRLLFTQMGNITGTWDHNLGILLLSGVDTVANYQAAIRSIVYENRSHNPTITPRTLSISVNDLESQQSNTVTRDIHFIATNNPPQLSSSSSALNYVSGSAPQPINTSITISDIDNTSMSSAMVSLTSFDSANDQLHFVANPATMGNIDISSNVGGVLTLSSAGATATLAEWQAALQAVTFTSTTTSLTPAARTVTFVVDDGQSTSHASNAVVTTVNIAGVFPPALTGTSSASFTEQSSAIPINTALAITNSAGPTLSSATIVMTNFVAGEDVLSFVNDGTTMGNIAVVSNVNGTLILGSSGGTATVTQWEAALHAVSYLNTSLNPVTTARNVTFQVDNGGTVNPSSNQLSSTVSVVAVNDPPVVANPDSTPAQYTEDGPGVSVFPNVTISDVDSGLLHGAVVQISGNYNALGALDRLLFTNTPNITGVFTISTGTLTLTGTETVANYEAALRSITFVNQYDRTAPTRTVSLSVTDDTGLSSNIVARDVEITTINNAPILSGVETTAQIYKYNDPYSPPPVISSAIALRDYDSTLMNGAIVTITGNYDASLERLGFDISGTSLRGSWDTTTGQLFIYGVDTVANYTKALRTVAYLNLGSQSLETRTISFQITDDQQATSNIVTRELVYVDTNVAPTLSSTDVTGLVFNEGSPATPIVPSLTISDPDSPLIQSATVKISNNYVLNEDRLVYTSNGRIRGFFQSTTATLFLSGTDTVANYQAALRSVQYLNTSSDPSTATRTVSFVISDGLSTSAVMTRNVTVRASNDPPKVLTNAQTDLTYSTSDGAVSVVPDVTVTDPDSDTLACASIKIVSNYQRGKDFLAFVNPIAGSSITGVFDAATGTLKLTGTDTVTNYRLALAAVTYQFVGTPESTMKTVMLSASDGVAPSTSVSRRIILTGA